MLHVRFLKTITEFTFKCTLLQLFILIEVVFVKLYWFEYIHALLHHPEVIFLYWVYHIYFYCIWYCIYCISLVYLNIRNSTFVFF